MTVNIVTVEASIRLYGTAPFTDAGRDAAFTFLSTACPMAFYDPKLCYFQDLPRKISQIPHGTVPIVLVSSLDVQETAYIQDFLHSVFPLKPLAILGDNVTPVDAMDLLGMGFNPNEIIVPARPGNGLAILKAYHTPMFPWAHHAQPATPTQCFKRSASSFTKGQYEFGDLEIDTMSCLAESRSTGARKVMRPSEASLLNLLLCNQDRVVPHHAIMSFLYGPDETSWPAAEILKVFKCHVSKTLGTLAPGYETAIDSVFGEGYIASLRTVGQVSIKRATQMRPELHIAHHRNADASQSVVNFRRFKVA